MRIQVPPLALVALLGGCAGRGDPADDTDPAVETDTDTDTDTDSDSDSDTDSDTEPPVIEAGVFTVQIPSDAAPDGGIAVRVFHPATGGERHAEGAPVVVTIPGGYDAGHLDADLGDGGADKLGLVVIEWLMPGGAGVDAESGGTFDYRGPACQEALADVLRYARGDLADADGALLSDRVPFAAADDVGILAQSNGGNLALRTLAAYDVGVEWLVTDESPIGDQYVVVDLGGPAPAVLNPYYEPGTCEVVTCPTPGAAEALAWDPTASSPMTDPVSGELIELIGAPYLDIDADGARTDADLTLATVVGPGAKAYLSTEAVATVDSVSERLFSTWPGWLATTSETVTFWSTRDGSLVYDGLHDLHPSLMVIALSSVRDHAQGQPDHPHVRSEIMGLRDGRTWFRLNPDAAYLALVTGEDETVFPDNPANKVPPYPGVLDWLLADRFDGLTANAAMLELADRVRYAAKEENLDAVLVEP